VTPQEIEEIRETHRRIVCAAYTMEDGMIISGVRHLSPDMRATMHKIYGDGYHMKISREHHAGGFIDQYGIYYNRKDAWVIAERQGQIINDCSCEGTLFSENLY